MIVRAFMWGGNPVLARLGLFLKSFAKMQLKRSLGREPTDHFPAAQSLQDRGLPFPAFLLAGSSTGANLAEGGGGFGGFITKESVSTAACPTFWGTLFALVAGISAVESRL